MIKLWVVCCLIAFLLMGTKSSGAVQDDLILHKDCKYCGMHRKLFAHSRMVVHRQDGSSVGLCSIHCAATEYLRNIDDSPVLIEVGDYGTHKLIDAARAWWVIGGNKPGVMTNRAKWAFKKRANAMAFVRRHGGRISDFDEAMKASFNDMYEDMRALKQMQEEFVRSKHAALARGNERVTFASPGE